MYKYVKDFNGKPKDIVRQSIQNNYLFNNNKIQYISKYVKYKC